MENRQASLSVSSRVEKRPFFFFCTLPFLFDPYYYSSRSTHKYHTLREGFGTNAEKAEVGTSCRLSLLVELSIHLFIYSIYLPVPRFFTILHIILVLIINYSY